MECEKVDETLLEECTEYFFIESEKNVRISCALTVKNPDSTSIFIICHGMLCHKNTRLIRWLALYLPYNTLRFDFEGVCGESSGEFSYASYQRFFY